VSGWLPEGTTEWGGRSVARTVAQAVPRCRAVLSGVVRSVAVRQRARLPGALGSAPHRPATGASLEAQFDDGSGHITLRWVGRDHIPGVRAGARLVVEGTAHDEHGQLVLLNPLYRFAHPTTRKAERGAI
jgi:hypothetical protein